MGTMLTRTTQGSDLSITPKVETRSWLPRTNVVSLHRCTQNTTLLENRCSCLNSMLIRLGSLRTYRIPDCTASNEGSGQRGFRASPRLRSPSSLETKPKIFNKLNLVSLLSGQLVKPPENKFRLSYCFVPF